MFERPEDYCDRRCELCPQRPACRIAIITRERERQHPDKDTMEWVVEDLTAAMAILERQLREEGIDPDALEPRPPPSPDAEALSSLGVAYAAALGRAVRLAPRDTAPRHLDELGHYAVLVAGKTGIVADALDHLDDGLLTTWGETMLLLEVVGTRIRRSMDAVFTDELRQPFDALHRELDRLMRPLVERVPAAMRAALADRIAAGVAPSPYLRRDEPWPD